MIISRKKIKLNGKSFFIGVYTYNNNRIRLKYENQKECHDITLDLPDAYLEDGKVFIDPFTKNNGLLKQLKKSRIIKQICGVYTYNYVDIPIAILNMGILRKYDNDGVNEHLNKVYSYE